MALNKVEDNQIKTAIPTHPTIELCAKIKLTSVRISSKSLFVEVFGGRTESMYLMRIWVILSAPKIRLTKYTETRNKGIRYKKILKAIPAAIKKT
jgi:hypothetical protein